MRGEKKNDDRFFLLTGNFELSIKRRIESLRFINLKKHWVTNDDVITALPFRCASFPLFSRLFPFLLFPSLPPSPLLSLPFFASLRVLLCILLFCSSSLSSSLISLLAYSSNLSASLSGYFLFSFCLFLLLRVIESIWDFEERIRSCQSISHHVLDRFRDSMAIDLGKAKKKKKSKQGSSSVLSALF